MVGQSVPLLFGLSTIVLVSVLAWLHAARLASAKRRHQEALDALSSSEERTRLIVEGALDAVVTIDSAGSITGWNTHAEATFGWTCEEVLGRELSTTIIPPRHAEAHHLGLRRFLDTGLSRVLNRRVELSAVDRSGREFPVEIAITPIRTSNGIGFCAFLRDITRRLEATAALHESEQRFRSLAESLPHLVWTCRPDGWCDFLSRQWVEYTGRPEAEQLGYGWADYLHPEDRERAQREWAAISRSGENYDIEFRIRRHDGAYRWFKTRAIPMRDAAGDVVKWFGSNTDVHDYKVSQQELRTQVERLHLLDRSTRAIGERRDLREIFADVLGSLETGLAVDFACTCTYDAAGRALTVYETGAASRTLVAALPAGTRIDIDAEGLAGSVSGQVVYEPDLTGSRAPSLRRLHAAGLTAMVLAPLAVESRLFGVLVAARRAAASFSSPECEFLRQLAEHLGLAAQQSELYNSLQAAYDDLQRTQQAILQQERLRALGQMSSGIAHDINNALSPAALYLQSMLEQEQGLSASARANLQIVERSIASVAETIGRLREFYREREPQQAQEAVDPNRALQQAAELTRARWHDMPQQRGIVIELVTDLAPGLPSIVGTASELRDAVTNLILNAVDAMPAGGKLTLQSRLLPGGTGSDAADGAGLVEISVRDSGIGMSAEARSRCLEPFYTTKGERGTGLGLAVVYGMLERHGARIEIDSEPGRGTVMRLLFPVSRTTAPASSVAPATTLRALRLLLVDDDPILLRSLQEILQSDGHEVVAATGGQAGIDALRATETGGKGFSAVITDLGMPHVDGRKVAAAAKSLSHPPPVVMLTGWGQRLIDDGDIPPHVDRVLGKPPRLAQLRAVLAELVG
jgi:PAS domain S-box-containing protein